MKHRIACEHCNKHQVTVYSTDYASVVVIITCSDCGRSTEKKLESLSRPKTRMQELQQALDEACDLLSRVDPEKANKLRERGSRG